MCRPEVLVIRCYRTEYGDCDVLDVVATPESLHLAKENAKARLLSFAQDRSRVNRKNKPHTADLVGEDERIVARFQARFSSSEQIAVVEVTDADRT